MIGHSLQKWMLDKLLDKAPAEAIDKEENDRVVLIVQIFAWTERHPTSPVVRQQRANRLRKLRKSIAFIERLREMLAKAAFRNDADGFLVDHLSELIV